MTKNDRNIEMRTEIMKVYLVMDITNSPGRVLAVFADKENAESFVDSARL